MYWVYIIRSLKTKYHYIGHTNDLTRRLEDHHRGKNKSVRGRGPWELVYKEEFKNRLSAIRREKEIKQLKGGNAFKELVGYIHDPIV